MEEKEYQMWPVIVREKNIGQRFEERFWDLWGPLEKFYTNPDIEDHSRVIKNIFCTYEPHQDIVFKKEDIALGLNYACGEFGEHTILFSYEKTPEIHCKHIWDCYIMSDFRTESSGVYALYTIQDHCSKEELYVKYLELQLVSEGETEKLKRVLEKSVYAKESSYLEVLEQILLHAPDDFISFRQYCRMLVEKLNAPASFLDSYLNTLFKGEARSLEILRKNFEIKLFEIKCAGEHNDLDSILLKCLAYLKNNPSIKNITSQSNEAPTPIMRKLKKTASQKKI